MAIYLVWSETRWLLAGKYSTGLRYHDSGRSNRKLLGITEIPGEEEFVDIGERRSMVSWDRMDKIERIYAKKARLLDPKVLKDLLTNRSARDTKDMIKILGPLDSKPADQDERKYWYDA